MLPTWSKTGKLKSKPKTQRAIIADILLEAKKPLGLAEIVDQARTAEYEMTFKRKQKVRIEDSVSYHLRKLVEDGQIARKG
jgi:hypothetical protein